MTNCRHPFKVVPIIVQKLKRLVFRVWTGSAGLIVHKDTWKVSKIPSNCHLCPLRPNYLHQSYPLRKGMKGNCPSGIPKLCQGSLQLLVKSNPSWSRKTDENSTASSYILISSVHPTSAISPFMDSEGLERKYFPYQNNEYFPRAKSFRLDKNSKHPVNPKWYKNTPASRGWPPTASKCSTRNTKPFSNKSFADNFFQTNLFQNQDVFYRFYRFYPSFLYFRILFCSGPMWCLAALEVGMSLNRPHWCCLHKFQVLRNSNEINFWIRWTFKTHQTRFN